MAATATAKKDAAAKVDGAKLYDALLAQVKRAKVGPISETKGMYFRVQVDGRTVAYVVKGKTVATVYPCTLADAMPADVTFRKVELGAHHYGRGEVIVSVGGEDDFPNAIAALKAAVKAPPVPKKAKDEKVADAGAEVAEVAEGSSGPAVTPNTVVIKDPGAKKDEPQEDLPTTVAKQRGGKKVTA